MLACCKNDYSSVVGSFNLRDDGAGRFVFVDVERERSLRRKAPVRETSDFDGKSAVGCRDGGVCSWSRSVGGVVGVGRESRRCVAGVSMNSDCSWSRSVGGGDGVGRESRRCIVGISMNSGAGTFSWIVADRRRKEKVALLVSGRSAADEVLRIWRDGVACPACGDDAAGGFVGRLHFCGWFLRACCVAPCTLRRRFMGRRKNIAAIRIVVRIHPIFRGNLGSYKRKRSSSRITSG